MYDDEGPEGGGRAEEEKEKKPAKKKRVQRPPKARPATKKKRPREGEQQEGPTDGKQQQPATQQQQQLSKPQKAPKEPSKAQKRAKAKDDTPSKARYEVITPKRRRGPPQVLTKKQLEEVERIAGEDAEEAEEDRIADLAHEPFYTHEGEEVRITLGRGLRLTRCCLVSCGSALAEGSCACHLVMQRVARASGLLAARWGTRLTGCCRTLCILRNPKRRQQDSMLRGVP